jgi:hypothetical protein
MRKEKVVFAARRFQEKAQNAQLTSWKIPSLQKTSCISSQKSQQPEVQLIKMPLVVWGCVPLRAS